jgi:hypothetical protein
MATNRFMQPIQGPRNQEFFKLDYDQLATGVLAREDAYEQNAAEIDALDQDYIKGIEGMESDRAKEINANIEGMVSTIGDKYNGDLSKSGDAIRNAKKYIKKTTGFDSEGALINANLKSYQANIKAIDGYEKYSVEEKNLMKMKALADHQASTQDNHASEGNFANYNDYQANAFQNIPDIALTYAKEVAPEVLEQDLGAQGGSGSWTADGGYQFIDFKSQKLITLTSAQIAQRVMPMLSNNPEIKSYLETTSGLNTFKQNLVNAGRFDQQNALADQLQAELVALQQDTSEKGITKMQQWLSDNGMNVDIDGELGTQTAQAVTTASEELSYERNAQTEKQDFINDQLGSAANAVGKLKQRNDLHEYISRKVNSDYTASRKAQKQKSDAAKILSGITQVGNNSSDVPNLYAAAGDIKKNIESSEAIPLLNAMFPDANVQIPYAQPSTLESLEGKLIQWSSQSLPDLQKRYDCEECTQAQINGIVDYQDENKLIEQTFNDYYNYKALEESTTRQFETIDFDSAFTKGQSTFAQLVNPGGSVVKSIMYTKEMRNRVLEDILRKNGSKQDYLDALYSARQAETGNGGRKNTINMIFPDSQLVNALESEFNATKKDILEQDSEIFTTDFVSKEIAYHYTGTDAQGGGNFKNDQTTEQINIYKIETDAGETVGLKKYLAENLYELPAANNKVWATNATKYPGKARYSNVVFAYENESDFNAGNQKNGKWKTIAINQKESYDNMSNNVHETLMYGQQGQNTADDIEAVHLINFRNKTKGAKSETAKNTLQKGTSNVEFIYDKTPIRYVPETNVNADLAFTIEGLDIETGEWKTQSKDDGSTLFYEVTKAEIFLSQQEYK